MRSTYLVGGAAAALILASSALAQTPSQTPEATNPAAGPATPAPTTTTQPTTPPYRGAATATAPTGPRLEAGAKVVNAQGAEVGEVVSVNQATDGTVTIDMRTKAGAVKSLPVAAFGSLGDNVAVRWNESQINAAPTAAARPATPVAPAAPATPSSAGPAAPGATPATPASPAMPAAPATPASPANPAPGKP